MLSDDMSNVIRAAWPKYFHKSLRALHAFRRKSNWVFAIRILGWLFAMPDHIEYQRRIRSLMRNVSENVSEYKNTRLAIL